MASSKVNEKLRGSSRQSQRAAASVSATARDDGKLLKADSIDSSNLLVIAFFIMMLVGTGNRIFLKLQSIPMHRYPFFQILLSNILYIPVCYSYIIPMILFGSSITEEQRSIPSYKFGLMGLLDSSAGIMCVFAVNYIRNGGMIVLLQQAAIPISMIISRLFLKARYTGYQYIGALVVIGGIFFAMVPTFLSNAETLNSDDSTSQLVWSLILVLSCIPMCLSSVYKEKELGEIDIDIIYLNGRVASFQFIVLLLFAVPSSFVIGLAPSEIPRNMMSGFLCMIGKNPSQSLYTLGTELAALGTDCSSAPFYVTTYLIFNIAYNVTLMMILKYGSANVLWLASTVMVPIGNVAFSFNFIPGHQDMKKSDCLSLVLVLLGLFIYRFSRTVKEYFVSMFKGPAIDAESREKVRLVEKAATSSNVKYIGLNQERAEYLEPFIESRVWKAQRANLARSPAELRGNLLSRLGIPPSPKHSKLLRKANSPSPTVHSSLLRKSFRRDQLEAYRSGGAAILLPNAKSEESGKYEATDPNAA